MATGTKEQPHLFDVDEEASLDSVEQDLEILAFDESDSDDYEIIPIDEDEWLKSSQQRRAPSAKLGDLKLPQYECESYRLKHIQLTVDVGDTVELKNTVARPKDEMHSGDFLRIKRIVKNLETDEVKLCGHRLRRTKYHGQVFDWKLNELVMVLHTSEGDMRDPFTQGLEDIAIEQVSGKRDCVITSKRYPLHNFSTVKLPESCVRCTLDECKQIIFHQGRLACRYINVIPLNRKKKSYSGTIRGIYPFEADSPENASLGHRVPHKMVLSVGDDEEDSIDTARQENIDRKGKRRAHPENPEVQDTRKHRARVPHKVPRYTFGDIFCGAGGSSQGARQADLTVKFGVDFDSYAMQAYRINFPKACTFLVNAHDFPPSHTGKETLKVDILHLSPPCCYWSPAHTNPGQNDQSNYEAIYTVGPIVKNLRPRVITLEQTFGLLTNREHQKNFKLLMNDIGRAGYDIRFKIEDLASFGLPQRRKRLLIIAARKGHPLPAFPKPTHGPADSGLKRYVSVADALTPIQRLGRHAFDDDLHQPGLKKKISKTPYNPVTTLLKGCITTSGGENYYWDGNRTFTPREASLLQSFPYGYQFSGGSTQAMKQIGNAFPPVMAEALYRNIARTLEACDNGMISIEDNMEDLDALLKSKGVVLLEQRTPPSLLSAESSESPLRHFTYPYRYLNHRIPTPQSVVPQKNSKPLFGGSRAIEREDSKLKPEKQKSYYNLIDDDDDAVPSAPPPPRHRQQRYYDLTEEDEDDVIELD